MLDYIGRGDRPTLPGVDFEIRHRSVNVHGTDMHLAEAGRIDGPTVVLLHGFPQHWYAWRHVMRVLRERCRVVAVDLPGFGWSAPSARGYSTAQRVRDVVALLDSEKWGSVDVVGHDWGALVALRMAETHPDRVRKAVAVSMTHLWPLQRRLVPNVWRWWVTALFEWPLLGPILAANARTIGWLLRRDSARPEVWTPDLTGIYFGPAAEKAVARAGWLLHQRLLLDLPGMLWRSGEREYRVPTLIVSGVDDVLVPPAILEVPPQRARYIQVHTIAGGHYMLDDDSRALTDLVTDHLELRQPPDGGARCWPPR